MLCGLSQMRLLCRAATPTRPNGLHGCRRTGRTTVPFNLGPQIWTAREYTVDCAVPCRPRTALHGRVRVRLYNLPFFSDVGVLPHSCFYATQVFGGFTACRPENFPTWDDSLYHCMSSLLPRVLNCKLTCLVTTYHDSYHMSNKILIASSDSASHIGSNQAMRLPLSKNLHRYI